MGELKICDAPLYDLGEGITASEMRAILKLPNVFSK